MDDSALDYLAATVGYAAAATVAAWWGGTRLYVPSEADPTHPIAQLAGAPVLAALVDEWGGGYVWISSPAHEARAARNRTLADRMRAGATNEQLAGELQMTVRRVQQLRNELAGAGLFGDSPPIPPRKKWGQKREGKTGVENMRENTPEKVG